MELRRNTIQSWIMFGGNTGGIFLENDPLVSLKSVRRIVIY
jgi:hypothetical protein